MAICTFVKDFVKAENKGLGYLLGVLNVQKTRMCPLSMFISFVPTTNLHMYHNSVQGSDVVKNRCVSFHPGKITALLRLSQVYHCDDPRAILGIVLWV